MRRYLFKTTGIRACSYNMKAAGVYTIAFKVTNSQGLSASVNRTLVVEPVCPYGETLCSNKARHDPLIQHALPCRPAFHQTQHSTCIVVH